MPVETADEPKTGADGGPTQTLWGADGHCEPGGAAADTPQSDESPFGPRRLALTVGLILTVVGVGFEALAVATVLPAVVDDLGGLHLYGWAFSGFLLTQLVGVVIAGVIA